MRDHGTRFGPVAVLIATMVGLCAREPAPPAQNAAGLTFTADEHLVRASGLYAAGKYDEAAALYRAFMANYGASSDAAEAIRQMRFPLAMCLIHTKKFGDALEQINLALAAKPPLQASQVQELTFWKGVSEMQEKEFGAARSSLEAFLALFPEGADRQPAYRAQFPAAQKIEEARLLIGTSLLLDEKFSEAAAYFASIQSGLQPAGRGRATVLELYALIQANDHDAAMKLVLEEYPRMADLLQIVTFQTLTLELGSRFLERGDYRKAILCLQRVWRSERLLKHQEARLADLESKREAAEANPLGDPYQKFLLDHMIGKVRRELENFSRIPNFDSALRLRLATAYQAMRRYRESALIMEEMLDQMSADPVVETASVNLVQLWNAIERWPKTIEAAQKFVEKFPKSQHVPLALYLQGIAEQKAERLEDAVKTFASIAKKYPESEFAPRAEFMRGFSLLLAERNKEAIEIFEKIPKKFPRHEMAGAAAYWAGMAYSLDKQFARGREVLGDYLADYKDGTFRAEAAFRRAYCAQQMENYDTSIKELRAFLRKHPGHDNIAEARVLLGDALMNEGQMEEGIAAFEGIPKADTRFYEEGIFKVAKALKLMEEYDKLRDHMAAFVAGSPSSPRVAEAIYTIGWVHRQAGKPDKARKIYWDAIEEYGDNPAIRSVDDLFPAVAKLYKGQEEAAQYLARLRDLHEDAGTKKKTLAMRTLWAQGLALKKSDPGRARELFLEAAALANVQTTNPLLLADFAEAMELAGRDKDASQMWRDLIKWNPRAPQKDRAFAALGMAELQRKNEKAALGWFDRFEAETQGSLLFGKVLLAKAKLLEAHGKSDEARATLESLLANRFSSGKEKAEALNRIGDIHMKAGHPKLAVPYYQRVYVMYGRWSESVARAYLRSGEAFEKLNDTLSARRTYQEMTEKDDLAAFEETARAREKLNALGGPLPKEDPAQG